MSVLNYKGYSARVAYVPDDDLFVGHIAGVNDVVGFHADTVADLKAAFHEAVDDYIATCEKAGKAPERTLSGRVMFRIAPEVHAAAAKAAELAGVSLNEWAEQALREAAAAAIIGRPAASIPETSPLYALAQLFSAEQKLEALVRQDSISPALSKMLDDVGRAPTIEKGKEIAPHRRPAGKIMARPAGARMVKKVGERSPAK